MAKKMYYFEIVFPKEYYINGVDIFNEQNKELVGTDAIKLPIRNASFRLIESANCYLVHGKMLDFKIYLAKVKDYYVVAFPSARMFRKIYSCPIYGSADNEKNYETRLKFVINKIKQNKEDQCVYSEDYTARAVFNYVNDSVSVCYQYLSVDDDFCDLFNNLDDISSNNFWYWEPDQGVSYFDSFDEANKCAKEYLKLWRKKVENYSVKKPLWSYEKSRHESFMEEFKYVIIVCLILLLIGVVMAVTKVTNWNILILFGGADIFTMLIAAFAMIRNNSRHSYYIYDEEISVKFGIVFSLKLEQIKKVKLIKNIFNKNKATIKIKAKNGLSLNYHFRNIKDYKTAYDILIDKLNKNLA